MSHVETNKHKGNQKIRDSEKKNSKITGFLATKPNSKDETIDVIRAETMMVDLVVELNLI